MVFFRGQPTSPMEQDQVENATNGTVVQNLSDTQNEAETPVAPRSKDGLHVLFLSSDTGGGHRASAESLANQFLLIFPGSTYEMVDVQEKDGVPPYNQAVAFYKHLSAHPTQWKIVYNVTNTRAFEMLADVHTKLMCERAMRKTIKSINPDVVVSVHPLMTNVPALACEKISQETGKHLPMFTVVTDLGSAHSMWFASNVEKLFVGSEQIRALAKARGKVTDEKIVLAGLPIRHDFSVQATRLGDRMSTAGKAYQCYVREQLELPHTNRKTVLVMGGGEGVGSLSRIVDALYVEFIQHGIDALILVVCGRNKKLKDDLEKRDWDQVVSRYEEMKSNRGISYMESCGHTAGVAASGCIEGGIVTSHIRRILSSNSLRKEDSFAAVGPQNSILDDGQNAAVADDIKEGEQAVDGATGGYDHEMIDTDTSEKQLGDVTVVGLGFVTRMAEYMVSADVLVSKAGPGTIAEASSVGLPVMLTSFLPGQEEGNVDYVVDGEFGAFCSDQDPYTIAEEVADWLMDEEKLAKLSVAAKAKGAPNAAAEIVRAIGDSALKWKEINEGRVIAKSPAPDTTPVESTTPTSATPSEAAPSIDPE